MQDLPHSSHASAICRRIDPSGCRFEWRPSFVLAATLLLLGWSGAVAVLASEVPHVAAWLLATASLLHGVRLAAGHRRLASVSVLCDGRAGTVSIDGSPVSDPRWDWRGPVAFLRWRDTDGRHRMLAFGPDVLDAPKRRELRLAAGPGAASRPRPSVAP